jgi:hypothetical protein
VTTHDKLRVILCLEQQLYPVHSNHNIGSCKRTGNMFVH